MLPLDTRSQTFLSAVKLPSRQGPKQLDSIKTAIQPLIYGPLHNLMMKLSQIFAAVTSVPAQRLHLTQKSKVGTSLKQGHYEFVRLKMSCLTCVLVFMPRLEVENQTSSHHLDALSRRLGATKKHQGRCSYHS